LSSDPKAIDIQANIKEKFSSMTQSR